MTRTYECDLAAELGGHLDAQSRVTAELVARVRAHVAECASCRERFEIDLVMADKLVRVPPLPPVPWRAPRWQWRHLLPGAAAAILLVLARWPAGVMRMHISVPPVAAVFQLVERRFRLGSDMASQYVITTTYRTLIQTGDRAAQCQPRLPSSPRRFP